MIITEIEFVDNKDLTHIYINNSGVIMDCKPADESYIASRVLSPEIWDVGDNIQILHYGIYTEHPFKIVRIQKLNEIKSKEIEGNYIYKLNQKFLKARC